MFSHFRTAYEKKYLRVSSQYFKYINIIYIHINLSLNCWETTTRTRSAVVDPAIRIHGSSRVPKIGLVQRKAMVYTIIKVMNRHGLLIMVGWYTIISHGLYHHKRTGCLFLVTDFVVPKSTCPLEGWGRVDRSPVITNRCVVQPVLYRKPLLVHV